LILVTGASGFLGIQLLQLLVKENTPIRAIYNNTLPNFNHPNVSWIKADLLDVFEVEEIYKGITHVYHCAAIVSFDKKQHENMIANNISITANIVNEALEQKIHKLIHVSSIAALGRAELDHPISEETFWTESKNNSAYSKSKYYSEMEVWRGMAEGLNAAIVNPGIILGEGDYSKGSAQLISNVAKEFPYYTEGVNAWVDVYDVARAMQLLMHSDISEQRFILSVGNFSYKQIFDLMADALHVKKPHKNASPFMAEIVWRLDTLRATITRKNALITKESARTAQTKSYYTSDKFLKAFPTFHYTSLEQTISRVAQHYQNLH
jgi:dihydroflavonol-4-reductase